MSNSISPDGATIISFATAKDFDTWLETNYSLQAGIWIKMAKKSSGIPSITSDEAVDVGLCWGWISGQRRSLDELYYLQKYVPRRRQSIWSQVNVEKVAELTNSGKMQAPGIAEVEAAKADGRWKAAYASQRNATTPPDLLEALAQNTAARTYFDTLNKTEQYDIFLQLAKQRTDERRNTWLIKIVTELASHKTY